MLLPRHVLITGGSKGIGLAIAQLFSRNNYRCTLLSRSEKALKLAVATLQPLPQPPSSPSSSSEASSSDQSNHSNDANGNSSSMFPYHTHSYIPISLTTPNLFSLLDQHSPGSITAHLPLPRRSDASRIDVLVNCAGVTQAQLFRIMSEEKISEIIGTNLTGLMVATKFLVRKAYFRGGKGCKHIREDDNTTPTIINVASLLGIQGGYGAVAYAASKAGVLGFTRGLASEYVSHGVRVNAIVPGYIETDMTKDLPIEQIQQRIPLGRLGKPSEIAQAALFLAENQYAHNCTINLDGGLSAV